MHIVRKHKSRRRRVGGSDTIDPLNRAWCGVVDEAAERVGLGCVTACPRHTPRMYAAFMSKHRSDR